MQTSKIRLSIVIPVYNEAAVIAQTLEKVEAYISTDGHHSEVVIVDDGSTDLTAKLVAEFAKVKPNFRLISNGANQGKGFSIRRGVRECRGDFVLFSDADLSTPIKEADKLLVWLGNGYDVAIGARGTGNDTVYVPQPPIRLLAGKTFSLMQRAISGVNIGDTQCGFKAYTRDAANKIFPRQRISGFAFDVENLFLAQKLGFRIRPVPVDWINNRDSRVRFLNDSLRMLADLAVIRVNSLRGVYR